MKDFVIYHNPEVMGRSASELVEFSVVTNKPVSNIEGDRVWLVTGEGRPRTFYLCAWFIADRVERNTDPEFGTCVAGTHGKFFHPMIELNNEQWFGEFQRSQGNFAFGLQPITDSRFIAGLESAASKV